MQNGNAEAFNGRMRDELLNETLFFGIDHAREAVGNWVRTYNTERPHSALGYLTPRAFAAQLIAMGDRLRAPETAAPIAHCSVSATAHLQPSALASAG